MKPARTIRKVGLVAKRSSPEALETARELAEWLERRGLGVQLETAGDPASGPPLDLSTRYDLVVVLGGDGTLLSVARNLAHAVPIFGVNLGTLGFLTEVGRDELYPSLVQVLAGHYRVEERPLFDVKLTRGEDGAVARFRAFNDAVIAKSALARIIELTLAVGGSAVARYRADGLIVSTPTGSTAYNLSAGGPIVYPRLPVAVITPICPHTLSMRPVVVPDDVEIQITLETYREEVYLTVDGQEGTDLRFSDVVSVRRADHGVLLVKVSERTFFDNLRGKLRWGGLDPGGPPSPKG